MKYIMICIKRVSEDVNYAMSQNCVSLRHETTMTLYEILHRQKLSVKHFDVFVLSVTLLMVETDCSSLSKNTTKPSILIVFEI